MNKSELIEALAARLGGRAQAAAAVEAVVDVVLREVAAGRSVGITGFGTFEKVERAPRTGRNPRTGEPVPIAGTSTPRFRPGAYFKDVVADPSALPSQGLAGARVGSDGRLERTGAPSSVRRAADAAGGAGAGRAAGGRAGTGGAGAGGDRSGATRERSGRAGGRGSRTSGAPDSVRRSAEDEPRTKPQQSSTDIEVPATGRIMAGGEDITQGMISAKKAQLARVQNDELAAKKAERARQAKVEKPKKATKGAKGKGEKAKGGKSKGKGAKGKKSKKSTK